MRIKRFVCALAAALLCLALSVTAYADTGLDSYYSEKIAPMLVDNVNATASIDISGSTANCRCNASGDGSVKSISVVMTLQKSGLFGIYTDVKDAEWSKSVTDKSILLSGSKSGLSNGTYRVKAVFTVTMTDGKSNTITEYSTTAKVG